MRRVVALLALILTAAVAGPANGQAAPANIDPSVCSARDFEIYFDEWQADLNDDARATLRLVQAELIGCRIESVHIIGAAGARGDAQANQEVSQRRAEAIADALAAGGWPREKFQLAAIGAAGATAGDVSQPMRRRARVAVTATAP